MQVEFYPAVQPSPVGAKRVICLPGEFWPKGLKFFFLKGIFIPNFFPLPFLPSFLCQTFLAFISAPTGFPKCGSVTWWAQLLITSLTATYLAHQKINVRWRKSWQSSQFSFQMTMSLKQEIDESLRPSAEQFLTEHLTLLSKPIMLLSPPLNRGIIK